MSDKKSYELLEETVDILKEHAEYLSRQNASYLKIISSRERQNHNLRDELTMRGVK